MVETLKISEMTDGGNFELDQVAPVLEGGANVKVTVQLQFAETGNTATRPPTPATPTIRYNTDFEQFEYWDGMAWVQFGSSGDVAALIARLAAHTVGDGASMIGLQDQGSVSNKDVQDLANTDFLVKTDVSCLVNGFAIGSLSTGFMSVQTGTGNLVSRTLTGATDQIDISNGTGLSGNPQISFAANPQTSGTSNLRIPFGTTGQRPGVPGDGMIRYNTTASVFEYYSTSLAGWQQVSTVGGSVASIIGTANQITASSPTGNVTLAIASNPVLPGSGGTTLPTGNTAARAGIAGTIRFNSQTSVFEGTIDGAAWAAFTTAAGTVISVSGTAGRITSTGGTTPVIDIDAAYVGQASITTLGTITTGVWNGSVVPIAYGGTSTSTATGTGSVVLQDAPTLTAPTLGDAKADSISHTGDLDNTIVFGTDTQNYETGGSSRMDISNSGFRLGGADARVTSILTDTTMAGAANTNLYTGLAVKTYVDNSVGQTFPAGTIMLFAQTSAPTGWTKNTTTNNNSALRVVTGAAGTGGTVDFTTAFASQAVAGTNAGYTLTTPDIPGHTHNSDFGTGGATGSGASVTRGSQPATATTSTGGGGSHTHTFTGTAINLAVKYLDVIQASKN